MFTSENIKRAFKAALPIMLGYLAAGIPCGLLNASIGLNPLQVFIMSFFLYSGTGQFMIPNMWLGGNPLASIVASVSLVNSRQILYSASFAPRCANEKNWLSFLFAATVTDESFGVNSEKFNEGNWPVTCATLVNLWSRAAWSVANVIGAFIGAALNIPLAVAAFAMTAIFICLMCCQKLCIENIIACVFAMIGVVIAKSLGLSGIAILFGALLGIGMALLVLWILEKKSGTPCK